DKGDKFAASHGSPPHRGDGQISIVPGEGVVPKNARSGALQCLSWVCAVTRRRFPVGANPTRRPLQPEATGAAMEVTKWLKPSDSVSRNTVTARVCRP